MNKLLLLLLLAITAQTVGASEERKIKLDAKHTLIISTPTNLVVKQVRGQKDWNAAIVIADVKNVSQMRFFVRLATKLETKETLTQKTVKEGRRELLHNAVEKEIVTKEKVGKEFSLVYFQLTDARSATNNDDGKYVTQGIGIRDRYVVEFLMLSKAQTEAEAEILNCLSDLVVKEVE